MLTVEKRFFPFSFICDPKQVKERMETGNKKNKLNMNEENKSFEPWEIFSRLSLANIPR